jgi:hypothetical protein
VDFELRMVRDLYVLFVILRACLSRSSGKV